MLIGKGRILLDGSLSELKNRSSGRKTLVVEYGGKTPELRRGMTLSEAKEGRHVITLTPSVLPVSEAIAHLAAQAPCFSRYSLFTQPARFLRWRVWSSLISLLTEAVSLGGIHFRSMAKTF